MGQIIHTKHALAVFFRTWAIAFYCTTNLSAFATSADLLQPDTEEPFLTQSITRTTTSDNITIAVENHTGNAATNATVDPVNQSSEDAAKLDDAAKHQLAMQVEQEGLLKIYRSNLMKRTYQYIVYPESAINLNREGEVVLRIVVDRNGKVIKSAYESRANYNSLNKAATRALNRAKPFPAVPARLKGEKFEMLIPIRFRLTG